MHGILGRMPSNPSPNGALADDPANAAIVRALQADGRLSIAELGRRVGLSAPAVAERLKRLEGEGVITGYHAHVDPAKLGYLLGVNIRVRPAPRLLADVARLAADTQEVVECHRITGDDCYVMTAYVRDVLHMEQLIDAFAAFGQTTSAVMQSSPVPRRGVAP